jgi:hypothetical protein
MMGHPRHILKRNCCLASEKIAFFSRASGKIESVAQHEQLGSLIQELPCLSPLDPVFDDDAMLTGTRLFD